MTLLGKRGYAEIRTRLVQGGAEMLVLPKPLEPLYSCNAPSSSLHTVSTL